MKNVFVVTGLDLGWDCVVGVFDADIVDYNELQDRFPAENYVIHDNNLESNLDNYE